MIEANTALSYTLHWSKLRVFPRSPADTRLTSMPRRFTARPNYGTIKSPDHGLNTYVTDPTPKHCLFCELQHARVDMANDFAFAIKDGFPVSPGHTLIVSRRHVASFFDTTNDERAAILELLDEAKHALDAELQPAAYNIGVNDGSAAGQTIAHLHVHLIPRYANDNNDPRGGVRWIFPEKAKYWA